MRFLLFILCASLMLGCSQYKNEPKLVAQLPQQAATDAMDVLQKLVNEQNYKSLGFLTIEEVQRARLGQPMNVYNMGSEKIKEYQAGQDPNSLLTMSAETIYPVTVGSNVRTGVTIIHKEQGYETSSFGNAEIVKRLSGYRRSPKEFAVRIPVLNMYFIGRQVETRVVLVPIMNDPRLKAQAGEATPIEVIVDQLRPYLVRYSGMSM